MARFKNRTRGYRDQKRKANDKSVPVVACPKCKRVQANRGPSAIYWCDVCRCQFDDDPDEGGDYHDRNPAARMDRSERR
jgi:ribosomal protein L37AE/L43A